MERQDSIGGEGLVSKIAVTPASKQMLEKLKEGGGERGERKGGEERRGVAYLGTNDYPCKNSTMCLNNPK